MRFPVFLAGLVLGAAAIAAPALPYDVNADSWAEVQKALLAAKADKLPVLLIFGANWCEDCRVLDGALKEGRNAELIRRGFKVVKIDVGRFDHNIDIANQYGNPIKKGIPVAVVLSADNQVLYATKGGELADARRMSESGIYDFFEQQIIKKR